jgi:hypothetical protein
MEARSPEDIRRAIESTREELTYSVNDLQGKVSELTNWRLQLRRSPRAAIVGAAVAGFVIGGGIQGLVGLFRR